MNAKQAMADVLIIQNGDAAFDTEAEVAALGAAAVANVELVIWEMTVPAQQVIAWGSGNAGLQVNQGYMWFALIDTGVAFGIGTLALCIQNNPRTDLRYVKRMSDTTLHAADFTTIITATPGDRNEMTPVPETRPLCGQDSRLQLRYTIAAAVAGIDGARFAIPCTRYLL